MAVETLSGPYASAQPYGEGLAGTVKPALGFYDFGVVVVEDGDIRKLCKVPKDCLVFAGHYWAGDLDSGTETIDIDIGWAANGGGSATRFDPVSGRTYTNAAASASAAGLVNSGVLTGDAIADLVAAGSNYRPFPFITGPLYFSEETVIQAEVNAGAATPASGQLFCVLYYILL